jgi:hypothetical protein
MSLSKADVLDLVLGAAIFTDIGFALAKEEWFFWQVTAILLLIRTWMTRDAPPPAQS